ncbi:MAG: lectin, partial [Deltaproteobacteria bacterium]|nr:lectin [Deltaproteobacteria bacterium]
EPVYAETGNWWHGLNDRQQEGQWAWTDGSPVDFEAWGEGEPNNAGTEDCAHIAYWSEGRWNDLHCEAVASYICQLP